MKKLNVSTEKYIRSTKKRGNVLDNIVKIDEKLKSRLEKSEDYKDGETNPGYYNVKPGWFVLIDPKDKIHRKFTYCLSCFHMRPDSYMLKNRVWNSVIDSGNGIYCLSCVEDLLGRRLVIDDFLDVPINKSIFFGYRMRKSE